MINAVSQKRQVQQADQAASVGTKAAQSKPQQAPTDTVQISSAAKSALQEAMETRAQTLQEAARGDNQAQRLLARDAAAAEPTSKK